MEYNSGEIEECTRKQTGPIKPGRKNSRKFKKLQWTAHPEGLLAKVCLYLWSTNEFGTNQNFRNKTLGQLGMTDKMALDALNEWYPDFAAFYHSKVERELTANDVIQRVHKFHYCHKGDVHSKVKGGTANFRPSDEHPHRNTFIAEAVAIVVRRRRATGGTTKSFLEWDLQELKDLLARRKAAAKTVRIRKITETV